MLNAIQEGSSLGDVNHGIIRATGQNRQVKSSLKDSLVVLEVFEHSEDMGQVPWSKFFLKIVSRAVHFMSHTLYKVVGVSRLSLSSQKAMKVIVENT